MEALAPDEIGSVIITKGSVMEIQVLEGTLSEIQRQLGGLPYAPDTRVRVTIEAAERPRTKSKSFLQTARSLKLQGPADWSARLDDYLYGGERL